MVVLITIMIHWLISESSELFRWPVEFENAGNPDFENINDLQRTRHLWENPMTNKFDMAKFNIGYIRNVTCVEDVRHTPN